MSAGAEPAAGAVTIPSWVVRRTFASETVLLDVRGGTYHAVNPVGGRMLDALEEHGSIDAAVPPLAAHFGQPQERIRDDLRAFCAALAERGLIELT